MKLGRSVRFPKKVNNVKLDFKIGKQINIEKLKCVVVNVTVNCPEVDNLMFVPPLNDLANY